MDQWIYESLSNVLGEELSEDLTQYILSVENEADFDDYLQNLFDFSNKEQRKLYENIKSAKFGKQSKSQNGKHKSKNNNSPPKKTEVVQEPEQSTPDSGKKKTKKFRKFQLSELQKGYLREGRNPCVCQATKHKLINNCLECGRIVCEQEGSGPCFFCDNMVCTQEELEILNSDTKESDALYRTLTDRKKSDTWKKAIDDRNKLLAFDKSVNKHTKIIDDEHDYFSVNNRWLSSRERERATARLEKSQADKHASRLGARTIVLDLLERTATEDRGGYQQQLEDDVEEVREHKYHYEPYVPDIDSLLEALKHDKANFRTRNASAGLGSGAEASSNAVNVIQDKAFLEMRDTGMCLSMHQPWATLLVLGIKQHEGRSWYTAHRGTLWIASTTKPADPDDVQQVEDFYRAYYTGVDVRFPDKYPTGCLVGNVLVQDCLGQDEYREQFPKGESESPYVFICSDPQKLIVPIPMKGEHKIYKISAAIHTMARDALILKRRFAV